MKFFKNLQVSDILGIGVDVAKDKLDICLLLNSHKTLCVQISNNTKSINSFLKEIANYSARMALEPTNRYHFDFLELAVKSGFKVVLANPLKVSQFRNFLKGKSKTDLIDSFVLSEIAKTEHFVLINEADLERSKIRQLVNQLQSLSKTKQIITSQIETLKSLNISYLNLKESLSFVSKQIKEIEAEIESKVDKTTDSQAVSKLIEIPGISKRMSYLLLALIDSSKKSKEVLSYAGLDPVVSQSGKSKREKSVSKRGSRYLRQLIYQIGFGAGVGTYGKFRSYYEKLKERGRHHIEATLIVGKKVLRIFLSILKSGKKFDFEKVGLDNSL